jgi:hypothetical protein
MSISIEAEKQCNSSNEGRHEREREAAKGERP